MRTTKPISTISFNTSGFLRLKLREYQKAKIIEFWAFVVHKPEDDEGGKKEHIHLYIEPAKLLQTEDLRDDLVELDPKKPDKPLKCLTFKSSKFPDWYMYALHDKAYLASKNHARRFHYAYDDFYASDDEELLMRVKSIDMTALTPFRDMAQARAHGVSFAEYFQRGSVPIAQINQYEKAWNLLVFDATDRNGRDGHENPEDNADQAPADFVQNPNGAGIIDTRTGDLLTQDDFEEI